MFSIGQKVTDGYFVYTVLAVTNDGFVTVSLCGHWFRMAAFSLVPN